MPIFETVNGWAVTIYLNDHLPVHFHAKKAGVSVRFYLDGSYEIEGRGKLSGAERKLLADYAKNNKLQIEEYWNELH
jgi:hypothetical protein